MQTLSYIRLYADANGESHFSNERMDLRPVDFAPPAPPLNLSDFIPAKQMAMIARATGWFGDWHPAPSRQFFIFVSEEVEVQASDGEVRRLGPGDILLLEDTIGKGHTSRVLSGGAAVIVQLQDRVPREAQSGSFPITPSAGCSLRAAGTP